MLNLITDRLTPRTLSEPAPSEEVVAKALAAAQTAPDHGWLRPWRFIVIKGEGRARFGAALAESLQERKPETSNELLDKERAKPLRAPLLIVVAASLTAHPKVPEIEQVMAASAAAQNLILAFHAQGFGCQWKSGAAAYDPQIKAVLGLHPRDQIIGFIYVGTIAEAGQKRPPHPQNIVSYWP